MFHNTRHVADETGNIKTCWITLTQLNQDYFFEKIDFVVGYWTQTREVFKMPVSPTSPTSDGVPKSNSFSNRMSKILHAAQSMSPTIGRKKVSKKNSNDNIGKWHLKIPMLFVNSVILPQVREIFHVVNKELRPDLHALIRGMIISRKVSLQFCYKLYWKLVGVIFPYILFYRTKKSRRKPKIYLINYSIYWYKLRQSRFFTWWFGYFLHVQLHEKVNTSCNQ